MKKIFSILFITLIFVSGISAANAKTIKTTDKSGKNVWEIGTELAYFNYKEPNIMKNTGLLYGITGSYARRDKLVLKAEGRFDFGQLDYKSVNTGTAKNEDTFLLEGRGLLGYDFSCAGYNSLFEGLTLTPFTGIGYRYLNNDSSGKITTTGHAGYDRESNYVYSPLGIEVLLPLGKKAVDQTGSWALGASAEYDHFWWGRQISHLSDVDPNFSDVKNTQKKGYGLRGSVSLRRTGGKFNFIIEPFIRYWSIKQSNQSNIFFGGTIWGFGWEPKNNSTEAGCRFALEF
ncbi:MAG: hypothetical protein PHN57_01620 [Candidatus Omnitrophica bacterium]|nr:hypothetical protein [Candidatus Omnitrophota bacterium]